MCLHVQWLHLLYTSDNIQTLSKTEQCQRKFLLQNLWSTVLYIYIYTYKERERDTHDWVDTSARGHSQAWRTNKIKTFEFSPNFKQHISLKLIKNLYSYIHNFKSYSLYSIFTWVVIAIKTLMCVLYSTTVIFSATTIVSISPTSTTCKNTLIYWTIHKAH
jgi:hypothetical protein